MGVGETFIKILMFVTLISIIFYCSRFAHKKRIGWTTISFAVLGVCWIIILSTVAFFPTIFDVDIKSEAIYIVYGIVLMGIVVGALFTILLSLREWFTK